MGLMGKNGIQNAEMKRDQDGHGFRNWMCVKPEHPPKWPLSVAAEKERQMIKECQPAPDITVIDRKGGFFHALETTNIFMRLLTCSP